MQPPRPRPTAETAARGCMTLGIVGLSQFVAGGSMCFVLVMAYVMQQRLNTVIAEKEARMVTVPVLARPLGRGSVILPDDLVDRRIDKAFVPKAALLDRRALVGRTLRERGLESEFLRAERLAQPSANQGFSSILAPNTRVVSLDLAPDERVAGFVEPGNLVDLVVTLPGDDDGDDETFTVAHGLRVLSVDERTSADDVEVRIPQVSLAVPLDQANVVVHAVSIGKPKLALRSDVDFGFEPSTGVSTDELLGTTASRMTVARFRESYTEEDVVRWMDVIHGANTVREPVVDPHLLRGIDGTARK